MNITVLKPKKTTLVTDMEMRNTKMKLKCDGGWDSDVNERKKTRTE